MVFYSKTGATFDDPPSKKILLELSVDNLRLLISEAMKTDSIYSQYDIFNWCADWYGQYLIDDSGDSDDLLKEEEWEVLADIDVQWDLYIANTYSFEEIKKLDFSSVRLPQEWWEECLRKLEPT